MMHSMRCVDVTLERLVYPDVSWCLLQWERMLVNTIDEKRGWYWKFAANMSLGFYNFPNKTFKYTPLFTQNG